MIQLRSFRARFRFSITLLLVLFFQYSEAGIVDTVDVFSPAMKKTIKAVVIRPDNYSSSKELPVFYLLHGYSDSYSGWVTRVKDLKKAADTYNMMIVCPDGGFSSWYWDSPIDPTYKYETFIAKELIQWIDSKYNTIKNRKGRAISGLSMGGHGALYLAFRNQDVFGAAGSTSGGVDIRPFPNNWDMAKRLGKYSENPEIWEKNTVTNLLHLLTPNTLSIIIDCGTSDFFFNVNEQLHAKLLDRNIPHDYITRPGAHNWEYWNNSIWYQLLFMNNFFAKGR